MLRSQELSSASDWRSFSPCRCSRLSASLRTYRSWPSLEPSPSEFTKRSCRLFRRHLRDILSSEFIICWLPSLFKHFSSGKSWTSTWLCHQKRFRTSPASRFLISMPTSQNCVVFSSWKILLTLSSSLCFCGCWRTLEPSLMEWPLLF